MNSSLQNEMDRLEASISEISSAIPYAQGETLARFIGNRDSDIRDLDAYRRALNAATTHRHA